MAMLSHVHQLFSAEHCQAYIHTLRWKDRPLQCPRCHSDDVGPCGPVPLPARMSTLPVPGLQAHLQRPHRDPVAPDLAAVGILDPRHLSVVPRLFVPAHCARGGGPYPDQLSLVVEADDLYHTAGQKGQAKHGGKKHLGRRARGRRKKREPGRGHFDKDRPAIIAWVSRQGAVVIQATKDFTVKTVQKAADLAVQAGSRLYTDSA